MTSGIWSSYLNSEVLSMTTDPAFAALGAKTLETAAPAEKNEKSMLLKSKSSRSSTLYSLPLKSIV